MGGCRRPRNETIFLLFDVFGVASWAYFLKYFVRLDSTTCIFLNFVSDFAVWGGCGGLGRGNSVNRIFTCTHTHTSCYNWESSLAFAHRRHVTLLDGLLQFPPHTHIHTHIHTYTHTHIHTYTHTHTHVMVPYWTCSWRKHGTLQRVYDLMFWHNDGTLLLVYHVMFWHTDGSL